jgi:hypothetical protein
VRDGADAIKIFSGTIEDRGVIIMPLDIAKAIVAEAHSLGRPVLAHPSNEDGVEVDADWWCLMAIQPITLRLSKVHYTIRDNKIIYKR